MRKLVKGVVLLASVTALSVTAFGQSSDAKYCEALMVKYRTLVGSRATGGDEVPVAMAKCQSGDYAAGIPVLEKVLKNNKIDLPPRT